MESILTDVNWLGVVVGAVIAFALGAMWYSPSMFGDKWRQGLGAGGMSNRPLGLLLVVQAIATFLFAWVIAVAVNDSMALAILVALTASILIKSNGLFSDKSLYAIGTEAGYIVAQAAIVLIVLQLFN